MADSAAPAADAEPGARGERVHRVPASPRMCYECQNAVAVVLIQFRAAVEHMTDCTEALINAVISHSEE